MYISNDEIYNLPFQAFRKTALLHARPLTEEDYQDRQGIIQIREGAASFQPSYYLARGVQDEEWPITREHLRRATDKSVSEIQKDLHPLVQQISTKATKYLNHLLSREAKEIS